MTTNSSAEEHRGAENKAATTPEIPPATAIAMRWADYDVLPAIMNMEVYGVAEGLDKYPPWVIRCGGKVCRALCPKAYEIAKPDVTFAYKTGIAIGMMQAGELQTQEAFGKLGIDTTGRELTDAEAERLSKLVFGSDCDLKCPKDGSSLIPAEISQTLAQEMDKMDLKQKSSFHQGMSDAIAMIAGKNSSTLATTPYSTMVIYWRLVDLMRSVEELHDFLSKIHGRDVMGSDIKRTRQLCTRVGKKFKPPGRPKTTSRLK